MQFPVPNYNHPHSEGKINDTNLLGILFNFDKGKMLAIRKSKGVGRPPKKNSLVICSLVLKIIIWVQAEKTSELVVILICKGNHFSCIWCVPSDILFFGGGEMKGVSRVDSTCCYFKACGVIRNFLRCWTVTAKREEERQENNSEGWVEERNIRIEWK